MGNLDYTDNLEDEFVNIEFSEELLMALKEVEDIKNNPDRHKGYKDMDELRKVLLSDD